MRNNISLRRLILSLFTLCTIGVGQMWGGNSKRIVFFKPDSWKVDEAYFDVHYWQSSNNSNNGDVTMTESNNAGVYYAFIPDWADRVQFVRRNPSGGGEWNRTGNQTLEDWYGQCNMSGWNVDNWDNTTWWNTYTVYYDDTETRFTSGASTPKLRVGTTATTTKDDMTKVTGTESLYKKTKTDGNWDAYHAFCFANAAGATGSYSIYHRGSGDYLITKQTEFIRGSLKGNFTFIGRSEDSYQGTGTDASCTYYKTEIHYGVLKYTVTNTSVDGGTVVLHYQDEDGTWKTIVEGSSAQVLPTTIVYLQAIPESQKVVAGVNLTDFVGTNREWNTSETLSKYVVRSDVTFTASFADLETKTVLVMDVNSWAPNMYFKGWNPFVFEWSDSHTTYSSNYRITTQKVADKVNVCGNDYYVITFANEFPFYYMHNEGESSRTAFFTPSHLTHMQKYNNNTAGDNNWGLVTTGCSGAIYWVEVTQGSHHYISNVVASTEDTLSFYAASGSTVDFHAGGNPPTNVYSSSIAPFFGSGQALEGKVGGVFTARTNGSGLTDIDVFDGDYHIHVNAKTRNYLNAGGVSKEGTTGTQFIKFDKSALFGDIYDHYWVDWFLGSGDSEGEQSVIATVGNKYNANLAGILGADEFAPKGMTQSAGGNVRYAYNPETNYFARAIVSAAGDQIKIAGLAADSVQVYNGSSYEYATPGSEKSFTDATYWNYQIKAKVRGTSHANVTTKYGGGTQTLASEKKLMGGEKGTQYDVEVTYDFKTNRLIAAWTPPDEALNDISLESNLILEREEDDAPQVLNINSGKALTNISQIYMVMKFTKENWADASRTITGGGYTDAYYWISLPYDCNISDIFGIPDYGTKWVIQTYHGDYRARDGWWAETTSWWYNLGRDGVMKANQGYVIRLTNLAASGNPFEPGGTITTLRLYFPSAKTDLTLGRLGEATTTTVPEHECTKWRQNDTVPAKGEGNPKYDRRVIDSNWNIIGSPSFNTAKITNPAGWTTNNYPSSGSDSLKAEAPAFKYFYTWAADRDPKYVAVDATNRSFQATHAYLVQYAGTITWTKFDDSNPLVGIKKAPAQNNEQSGEQTLKLVLKRNGEQADVAYISRMAEGATEGYDLNLDLSKLLSASGDNLYTFAGYYKMAGNCLPDTVSSVPVGVQLAHSGEYTFALPDGSNGIGVVLVDKATDTRTNLGLTDYTVALEAGTYNNRFSLELSPMSPTPTDVKEITGDGTLVEGARKVLMDGTLYIVRDGKVFDARGTRIQ